DCCQTGQFSQDVADGALTKQKSLTLKMSAKSEANIDRFCELTQSWLPMEKTEKDPVSGVWTVRNSGK
ncbi:GspL/Epsl periplasmic domain-containing protein, partial [Shigella boydii]|uniref:GspL/Epsl periplasmic domain-containing protein n=1 Tax=Shigella boydii TaxID=621 RepID=UPI000ED47212